MKVGLLILMRGPYFERVQEVESPRRISGLQDPFSATADQGAMVSARARRIVR
jgi:hypothetical protein